MWLSEDDVRLCAKFVFDIEFIGDITKGHENCHPWEIAVLCVDTNQKFYCPIMPQMPKYQIENAFTSTDHFSYKLLQKLNAQSPGPAYRMLAAWIHKMVTLCQKSTALMISHNCFASDMPILCRQMHISGASFVCPVLFFDSLLFCRYSFRGNKTGNFSLDCLFELCNGSTNAPDMLPHRAISDTKKLHAVLLPHYNNISGLGCFPGSIALTVVSGIGTSTARLLTHLGIEDLQVLRNNCIQQQGDFNESTCCKLLVRTGVKFAQDIELIAKQIVDIVVSSGSE